MQAISTAWLVTTPAIDAAEYLTNFVIAGRWPSRRSSVASRLSGMRRQY